MNLLAEPDRRRTRHEELQVAPIAGVIGRCIAGKFILAGEVIGVSSENYWRQFIFLLAD